MPIDVAMGLLGVAKEVFAMVTGDKANQRAERASQQADNARAADYFAAVGATLAEIAAEIAAGRTPYGKCGELVTHAQYFVSRTQGVIGQAEAARLADILYASHDVEGMAMRMAEPAERSAQIAALSEASGRFSAMAHIVRAGG